MDGIGEEDFYDRALTPNDVLKIQRMYGCGKSIRNKDSFELKKFPFLKWYVLLEFSFNPNNCYKFLSNKEQQEYSSFKLFTHKNNFNPYERFHIQYV